MTRIGHLAIALAVFLGGGAAGGYSRGEVDLRLNL